MPEFDPRQVDASLPLYDPPNTLVPKDNPEVSNGLVCTLSLSLEGYLHTSTEVLLYESNVSTSFK